MKKHTIQQLADKLKEINYQAYPIFQNTMKLIEKGFGGLLPLASGLIISKILEKKIVYHPTSKGCKPPKENEFFG